MAVKKNRRQPAAPDTPRGICYIVEFTKPLLRTGPNGQTVEVRFYTGYVSSPERLEARLQEHAKGQGAAICRAACEKGAELRLKAVIPNCEIGDEKRIKKQRNVAKFLSRLASGRVRTSWALSLSPILSYGENIAVHAAPGGQTEFYGSAFEALDSVYRR